MPAVAFVIPIPSGKTEIVKNAFEEMRGSRESQCVANRHVMGISREFVSLHHTNHGDVLVAYLEGDDPSKAMERMMASDSEYARWIAKDVMPLLAVANGQLQLASETLADWRA